MDEFELIRRYFAVEGEAPGVKVGVGDDGAVLATAAGRDLVAVVDTQIEGVHYPPGLDAEDVGYRAVAVNLSDIAAMGARPRWMTLALTLVKADPDWLRGFSAGLQLAAAPFGMPLVGGDTTRGDRTVVSIQIIGDVEPSLAMLRSGANPGDRIYLSGTVGDAAAGRRLMDAAAPEGESARYLSARFLRPVPRVALGAAVAPLASAAIDVSDGVFADLGKLLRASGCGGCIDIDRLPLSGGLRELFSPDDARDFALSGGDDYELCFTAPAAAEPKLLRLGAKLAVPITPIGSVDSGEDLVCRLDGKRVEYDDPGYTHF